MYVVLNKCVAFAQLTLVLMVCNPICVSPLVSSPSLGDSAEQLDIDRIELNANIPVSVRGNTPIESAAELTFDLTQALNLQRQERVQRECELAALPVATDELHGRHQQQHNDADGNRRVSSSIQDYAQQMDGIPDDQLEHLLIDEKHKFLYCYVPKVSSCLLFMLEKIIHRY